MLVVGFPAPTLGTNCWVVAPAPGEECVVVDPGIGVGPELDDVLLEHRLRPVAVLLTHGHLDHTASVAPVCGARGVPALVHPLDAHLLADPLAGLSPESRSAFAALPYTKPDDVGLLQDGADVELAGLTFRVDHAPGHTAGSVLFGVAGTPGPGSLTGPRVSGCEVDPAGSTLLSGDVLFAGSIGRTDLPGGSRAAMLDTLATRVLTLDDDTVVLPGHGPHTSIRRERAANPYLLDVAAGAR